MRLEQDDVEVLPRGADGDPAKAVGRDVVAYLETQRVALEAEGRVRVVDGDEHGGDGDCHATTQRGPTPRVLLRSCSASAGGRAQSETGVRRGRVTTLLTHTGMAGCPLWSRARYCDGTSPTISVNRELKEPSDVHPTAKQVSVTDIPCRSNAFARSIRRVIRYEYGELLGRHAFDGTRPSSPSGASVRIHVTERTGRER